MQDDLVRSGSVNLAGHELRMVKHPKDTFKPLSPGIALNQPLVQNEVTPSHPTLPARAVKSVKFGYVPTPRSREILESFRAMVNHAIHICLEENIKGRLKLRDRIYKEFKTRYDVLSAYPYSVAEVAWSIVKKHRKWHRSPSASRLMLKMDSANYSFNYGIIGLPFKKGERLLIPLRYGDWQRSFLMDESLKRGSLTMTEDAIIITFSKETRRSSRSGGSATTLTRSPLSAPMAPESTCRKSLGCTPSMVSGAGISARHTQMTDA